MSIRRAEWAFSTEYLDFSRIGVLYIKVKVVILPSYSHPMSYTSELPTAQKSAYKRPYKSRHQRREADRRKHDESSDTKFLVRVAVGVAIVLALALVFVLKGSMSPAESAPIEALQ